MNILKGLKSNKGEGYIDLLISLIIIFTVIYMIIMIFPAFIYKQNIDYMARHIVKTIEMTGEKGEFLEEEIDSLKEETGISPEIIIEGEFKDGKLQIKEKFSVELRTGIDIVIGNNAFMGDIKITIPIRRKLSGISEVYFK